MSLLNLISILSILLIAFVSQVASKGSSTGNRLLVVLDSVGSKKSYSSFFDDLEQRGYQITFRGSKESTPELYSHEEMEFDQLLLMAPTAKCEYRGTYLSITYKARRGNSKREMDLQD